MMMQLFCHRTPGNESRKMAIKSLFDVPGKRPHPLGVSVVDVYGAARYMRYNARAVLR